MILRLLITGVPIVSILLLRHTAMVSIKQKSKVHLQPSSKCGSDNLAL
jgi:hypothetical protein